MEWAERLRRYQSDRDTPSLKDAATNAYEVGYMEGENSAWADVTAYLDEWGEAAFLAWVKRRMETA